MTGEAASADAPKEHPTASPRLSDKYSPIPGNNTTTADNSKPTSKHSTPQLALPSWKNTPNTSHHV